MTVRELLESLNSMVQEVPGVLDEEVRTRNDEFNSWDEIDPAEDLTVVQDIDTGEKFLAVGLNPLYYDDGYKVLWPKVPGDEDNASGTEA